MMQLRKLFFFIGTEAELIKIFPVMLECKARGLDYNIIASGQNNIVDSQIFKQTECGHVDLELSSESDIKKTAAGLLVWWVRTKSRAVRKIRDRFPETGYKDSYMIVHGDTVSTYMGACVGKALGMTVCHIEAGLRSHRLYDPFPEEIDRLLTSRIARIHFAPGQVACANLSKARGRVVDTVQNTLLDSLHASESIEPADYIRDILDRSEPYCVFVMHRQENLADEKLVRDCVKNITIISGNINVIVILHTITGNTLRNLGLLDELERNSGITLLSRVEYFSFMKLLNKAEYVITDGGSNQEELYYMGVPALIMRHTTERNEGIGENVMLYSEASDMLKFASEYRNYIGSKVPDAHPSGIIADELGR